MLYATNTVGYNWVLEAEHQTRLACRRPYCYFYFSDVILSTSTLGWCTLLPGPVLGLSSQGFLLTHSESEAAAGCCSGFWHPEEMTLLCEWLLSLSLDLSHLTPGLAWGSCSMSTSYILHPPSYCPAVGGSPPLQMGLLQLSKKEIAVGIFQGECFPFMQYIENWNS